MKNASKGLKDDFGFALFENQKIDKQKAKQKSTPFILEAERQVTDVEYGKGRVFGKYLPTATMIDDESVTIQVKNLSCLDIDVKLFYTGDGFNNIKFFDNNRIKRKCIMTTDNWGNNFLDADGNIWVNDGVTLPFSFSAALACELLGSTGSGILTTLTTNIGEPIDSFFLRLMEALSASGLGNGLANASAMGAEIYYNGGVCYVNPSQYSFALGSNYVAQSFEITTGGLFPQTSFQGFGFPFGFPLIHPDGWNVFIEVRDLSTTDNDGYAEFVNSLLNQDLFIKNIKKYSNNIAQVGQPVTFESYDSDGNEQKLPQTNVISPYQPQAVLNNFSDIVLDGQTFATINMLAGEFLELTLYYDSVGILNYEEIKELEIGQGKELTKQEDKDLIEAYSNFSGFKNNKKTEKLLLLAILGLIIFKK